MHNVVHREAKNSEIHPPCTSNSERRSQRRKADKEAVVVSTGCPAVMSNWMDTFRATRVLSVAPHSGPPPK